MKNNKFFNVSEIARPSIPSIKLYALTKVTKKITVMIWAKAAWYFKKSENTVMDNHETLINKNFSNNYLH